MKYFFTAIFISLTVNVFAQDTTYSSPKKDSVAIFADTFDPLPQFQGGDLKLSKYLLQNIKYPNYAREYRIEGTVYISFIVEEDGTLTDIEVLKSPHKVLSEEALRIVQLMPKWEPALQGGNPVKFKYTLPINFVLK